MQTRSQTNNKRVVRKTNNTVSRPVTRSQTKQRVQELMAERAGWDYEPKATEYLRRSPRLNNANNVQLNVSIDKHSLPVAKPKATEQLRRSPRLANNIQLNITENTYDDDDSDYYPESDNDDIDIDFEEASRAWRQNKTYIGNGMFKYNTRYSTRSRA